MEELEPLPEPSITVAANWVMKSLLDNPVVSKSKIMITGDSGPSRFVKSNFDFIEDSASIDFCDTDFEVDFLIEVEVEEEGGEEEAGEEGDDVGDDEGGGNRDRMFCILGSLKAHLYVLL